MKHFLTTYDATGEEIKRIEFPEYDKEKILSAIKEELSRCGAEEIEHSKENTTRKHYGDEILNFYGKHPRSGKPCKLIVKSERTNYLELS